MPDDHHDLSEIEEEWGGSIEDELAEVCEAQDQVVALLCNFRAKLDAEGFSAAATEEMVVQYHGQLRG